MLGTRAFSRADRYFKFSHFSVSIVCQEDGTVSRGVYQERVINVHCAQPSCLREPGEEDFAILSLNVRHVKINRITEKIAVV